MVLFSVDSVCSHTERFGDLELAFCVLTVCLCKKDKVLKKM